MAISNPCDRAMNRTACVLMYDGAVTPALVYSAALSSVNGDGDVLTWTSVDPSSAGDILGVWMGDRIGLKIVKGVTIVKGVRLE